MARWYARRYEVELDTDTEILATIGAKEGVSHFVLAAISRGDTVLVPDPCYGIHGFSVVIAGGDMRFVPLVPVAGFLERLEEAVHDSWPRPKMIICSFPHNPTTTIVDLAFLRDLVLFCLEHDIILVHDLAYAELCFDGYKSPSVLQVPEARDIAIEFTSLSKSHSMAGWEHRFEIRTSRVVRESGVVARSRSELLDDASSRPHTPLCPPRPRAATDAT